MQSADGQPKTILYFNALPWQRKYIYIFQTHIYITQKQNNISTKLPGKPLNITAICLRLFVTKTQPQTNIK